MELPLYNVEKMNELFLFKIIPSVAWMVGTFCLKTGRGVWEGKRGVSPIPGLLSTHVPLHM